MPRRLRISTSKKPALTVAREAISKEKFAYVLTANRTIQYPYAKSAIVYIGTTARGLKRITETVAARAKGIFAKRGVNAVEVHVIKCQSMRRVRGWEHLEHALLFCFKQEYGDIPIANKIGKGNIIGSWRNDLDHFNRDAVIDTIRKFDTPSGTSKRRKRKKKRKRQIIG